MNERGVTIAVASDRSLVGDAVAAALAGSDLDVVRVPWPGPRNPHAGWSRGTARPGLGLMICDLVPPSTFTARWLLGAFPTRWLLLTDTAKGAGWGAVLELGVVGILPSGTGLADVLDEIRAARAGGTGPLPDDREDLVAAWRHAELSRTSTYGRMSSLTPRESQVLRELHRGHTVQQIAELHGVACSTVRSQVRSVLRKLEVSTQLAATVVLEKCGGNGGG